MYTETIADSRPSTADLNGAPNAVLHTYVFAKPGIVRRFGVVADGAPGLLAPMRLKLRRSPAATGTAADIPGTQLGGPARARGFGYVKTLGNREEFKPGDVVTVCIDVAAGGTSTGRVWVEIEPLPAQQIEQPNIAESTV